MFDVLTDLRTLLLTFTAVTNAVGERIRPHRADSSDGTADVIVLDLPDANQFNCLSGESIVAGNVIVRTRSTNKTNAAAMAEAVRSNTANNGLDGYTGPAGTGHMIQSERIEFSQYDVDDEDDDNATYFETESLYLIWFQNT